MQADSIFYTPHDRNLRMVLRYALRLAERAGECQDAAQREVLIAECMACWRAAGRLKSWPGPQARA